MQGIVFADQAERFTGTMGAVAQSTQQVLVLDLGIAALSLIVLGLGIALAIDVATKSVRRNTRARVLSYLATPAE